MKYHQDQEVKKLFIQFQSSFSDYTAIHYAAKIIVSNLDILFEKKNLKTIRSVLKSLEWMESLDYTTQAYREWSLNVLKQLDEKHGNLKADKIEQMNEAYTTVYSFIKKDEDFICSIFDKILQSYNPELKKHYVDLIHHMLNAHVGNLKKELQASIKTQPTLFNQRNLPTAESKILEMEPTENHCST